MAKETREHTAEEFGKGTSGGIRVFDPPMIGAPTSILIDGLVERESGHTPSSWSVSVTGIVVFLVAMLAIGVLLAWAGLAARQATLDSEQPPVQRVTTYVPPSARATHR
jgi:hypothetical protein